MKSEEEAAAAAAGGGGGGGDKSSSYANLEIMSSEESLNREGFIP